MRKPATPGPAPITPLAQRLEDVRARSGYPSLRSFWAALVEDWPEDEGPVSYEAARNYHYDSRSTPTRYVARVAKVFSDHCTAEWLLTGEGPTTEADRLLATEADQLLATEERAAVGVGLRGRLPGLTHMPFVVSAALMHHLSLTDSARARRGGPLSDDGREDYSSWVWDHIRAPFSSKDREPLPDPAFTSYVLAALHALDLGLAVRTTQEEDDDA